MGGFCIKYLRKPFVTRDEENERLAPIPRSASLLYFTINPWFALRRGGSAPRHPKLDSTLRDARQVVINYVEVEPWAEITGPVSPTSRRLLFHHQPLPFSPPPARWRWLFHLSPVAWLPLQFWRVRAKCEANEIGSRFALRIQRHGNRSAFYVQARFNRAVWTRLQVCTANVVQSLTQQRDTLDQGEHEWLRAVLILIIWD